MRSKDCGTLQGSSGDEAQRRSRSSARVRPSGGGAKRLVLGTWLQVPWEFVKAVLSGCRARPASPSPGPTFAECSAQGRPATILPAPSSDPAHGTDGTRELPRSIPSALPTTTSARRRRPGLCGIARCSPQPVRGRPPVAVVGGVLPAFPAQRQMASDSPCFQRGEIRFIAVAGFRKHLRRHLPARCRGRVHHGQQLPPIRRPCTFFRPGVVRIHEYAVLQAVPLGAERNCFRGLEPLRKGAGMPNHLGNLAGHCERPKPCAGTEPGIRTPMM